MSNEITVYDRVTDPIQYAEKMGFAMAKSGMFGLPNEQAGMVVAMTCLCDRITPMEFGRTYHIIQGKPSMKSDAMLAEFRKRGGKHEVIRRDPDGVSVKLTAHDGGTGVFALSWEEAKGEDFTQGKDGGIKENYAYPRKRMQMLWARVISDGVRTLAPEIVAGIYTPEETEDFQDASPANVPPFTSPPTVAPDPNPEQNAPDTQAVATKESDLGEVANDVQVAKISQLMDQLEFPPAKVQGALKKRGVVALHQLSPSQADEMIEILYGMVAAKN